MARRARTLRVGHALVMSRPVQPEPDIALGGARWLWIAFALGWLLVLAVAFAKVIEQRATLDLLPFVAVLVMSSLVAVLYVWLTLHEGLAQLDQPAPAATPRQVGLLAAMTALIVALIVVAPHHSWWWIFQHPIIAAGLLLPPARAVVVAGALLGLGLGSNFIVIGHVDPMLLIQIAFGASAVAIRQLTITVAQLQATRRELAHLAVAEERLRIGRDLHDLLGHSLSAIVLKTELAGRLLHVAPEKAAAELADVQSTARDSLAHVREVVAEYRQPTLDAELTAARDLLAAAGIAVTVDVSSAALPTALDGLLAWAVREGVTNVVRHSRARNCNIRVGRRGGHARVAVTDDGLANGAKGSGGTGLTGLAERAAKQGGQLQAGPLPEGGFRLALEVPL
jgi:two-component system, NarL family, sensor histidine kinase DesK